ncbi:hypothetical protein J8F10_15630 [Gemmata sp. G18]|uniref:Helix-turn-helix domain-containing protein n=1 Tax=Gemmata palustris TaxID=2822762 RepID=A0ABS5BTT3_9BACT|nr:hypothetical protein [Gemmata palustris]MBP3956705.1 hypothetical protein [Gemmata palustris]
MSDAQSRFDKLNAFIDHGQAPLRAAGCGAAAGLWLTIWRFERVPSDSACVSVRTLAECYGSDTKAVRRMLDQLEEHGYLVTLRAGDVRLSQSAVYRLVANPGLGASCPQGDVKPEGTVPPALGAPCPQPWGHPALSPGGTVPPIQKEQKKNKDKDPLTPAKPGGPVSERRTEKSARGKSRRATRTESLSIPIPGILDTPAFREWWATWLGNRKKPVTTFAAKLQLDDLAPFGPESAVAAIKASLAAGWTGLFPKKLEPHTASTSHAPHTRSGAGSLGGGHRVEPQPGKYVRPAAPGLQTRRPIVPGAIRAPESSTGPRGAFPGATHGDAGADEGTSPVAALPLEPRTRDRENVGRADAA